MPSNTDFIQIADSALAKAYAQAGEWMACKPGCHQCCIGVFPISALDADRLRTALLQADPEKRARIEQRAIGSRDFLTPDFPGNRYTGELFTEPHHEHAFEDFANEEPCPVLDPETGTCDLYSARPMACRTFGPPMPNDEGGLAVCELCFAGAPASEVARCAVDAGFLDLEAEALAAGQRDQLTLIAFALTDSPASHRR